MLLMKMVIDGAISSLTEFISVPSNKLLLKIILLRSGKK
jgi:hypothetical protein